MALSGVDIAKELCVGCSGQPYEGYHHKSRLESGGGEGSTVAAGRNHLTSQDGMTLGM